MEQYILMIYSDNCDPFAYGVFTSEKDAEYHLSKLQESWSESEWYHHKDHILKLKEINKRSKS
jgi:hypothetical protein